MKRGNLLWTGSRMMLSEHRQALNERLYEQVEEDVKIGTDEQQLEEWQEIWDLAVENNERVTITYGMSKKQVTGWIAAWSGGNGLIHLKIDDENEEEIKNHIRIKDIVEFTLAK